MFEITPAGTLTTLYSFCSETNCTDGDSPWYAGLVQASNGNLYGTTLYGGANDYGTVFEITTGGVLTTLHSFDGTDGDAPTALVQASNGNFYGTTVYGGANYYGTVFKITAEGVLTTLHSFDGTDGAEPYYALVQASNRNHRGEHTDHDGNFYGTTQFGGADDYGTVFEITAEGVLTTLHSFDGTDGAEPLAGLVQARNRNHRGGHTDHEDHRGEHTDHDGNFYGTTIYGGANDYGTVFEITPAGTLTTLHSFDYIDGEYPYAGLVQASNGNFYGTTGFGGAYSYGTVFELTPEIPFATFSAFPELSPKQGAFAVGGEFTLGRGGTVDLSSNSVTLRLGSFSTTIPAGSFQEFGVYVYEGTINGVHLIAAIQPFNTTHFAYGISASGATGLPTANPITVELTVGDNSGTASVKGVIF